MKGKAIRLILSGDHFLCYFKACAYCVVQRRANNAPVTAPLAIACFNQTSHMIQPTYFTKALKDCVSYLVVDLSFLLSDVIARRLRALGAYALLLAKVITDLIHLIG